MKEKRNQVVQNACQLLGKSSIGWDGDHPSVELLAGDGSQRTFYRLRFKNGTRVVAIAPSDDARQGMAEARSAWDIGKHLRSRGIPVPEYFAYDAATGLILSEDLGDTRLYEYVTVNRPADEDILAVYRLIVHELVRMQVRGGEGFQPAWCYQTPLYDRRLMLERESGYFMEALCQGLLQMDASSPFLQREFEDVADRAAAAPAAISRAVTSCSRMAACESSTSRGGGSVPWAMILLRC